MIRGEWRANIARDTLEVSFPSKPSAEIRAGLKSMGFRWARASQVWYAPDARQRREFLATIADRGEDTQKPPPPFAEIFAAREARAEARRERREAWAAAAAAESVRHYHAAGRIGHTIPLGQPILVGHHSEAGHRRDLARMDAHLRRSVEARERAKHHEDRAEAAGASLRGYNRPDFLARRIRECEAEIRRLERERTAYNPARWEVLRSEVQSKLDFCRQRLEDLGGIAFNRDNVHAGMRVRTRHGTATVKRANPKTVTLHYDDPETNALHLLTRIPYEEIQAILDA